jgi:peptidoglycan-associated lipoprotein
MKIAQLIVLAAATFCFSTLTIAQTATKKADQQFENQGYYEAAKLYKVAEPTTKALEDKARIFYQIGECYRLVADHQQALEWYEKAITAQYYNTNPEVYYNYGLSLQELEKWDDATAQFNKYIAKGGEKSKANARIKACQDAATRKAAKTKIVVENMAELNSPFFDYGPMYSAKKGEQIVFASSRQSATGTFQDPITGESFMDFFFTEKDKKNKWSAPQPISGEVNTQGNEGAAAFNKDFSVMYYTSCRYESAKSWFACDIMRSTKSGDKYTQTSNLNILDRSQNDTSQVGHPFLTSDEKYLMFASDMPGGKGGKDIWYMMYDKANSTWNKPVNLAVVNTPGDEMFPYIGEDGTFYFASNGHNGLGGMDIFKAAKSGEMSFGAITTFDYPINSSADDFGLILETKPDSDKSFSGFFTSNRPGGKGKDDIYHFFEPPLEFSLTGTAYDKDTGSPIPGAEVSLVGSSSNGDPINLKATTDGNGGFNFDKVQIKGDYTYTVDIRNPKYIGTGDKFSTVGLKASTNFAREYFLIPIPDPSKEIEMPLVLYPYNEATLLVNSEINSPDSLNYLLDILQKNQNLVVQLEAHTDARGKDQYNLELSDRRAKTCVDYLISKGIAGDRLVAKGMGETQPRVLSKMVDGFEKGTTLTEAFINKLPKERQEIAHTLNRRTIFKVIGTNYVPKK